MTQIRNSQQKTYGVEDVRLARSIEACDGIERHIESVNNRSLAVRLKAVDDHRLDMHLTD